MDKRPVPQSDFTLGEIRPEFLESDGSEIRARSVQMARNVRPQVGGGFTQRYGSYLKAAMDIGDDFSVNVPEDLFIRSDKIEPVVGTSYKLVLFSGGLHIYQNGALDAEFYSLPWTDHAWVAPARENIFIGSADHEIYVLNYNADTDTWSIGTMDYADLPGGELAQPYYAKESGVDLTITGGYTGSVTITASSAVFTSDYVGLRIKFHGAEITITGYTSTTVLTGTVVDEIPPGFDITVNDASGFSIGEVIVGESGFFEGYIYDISGSVLKVQTLKGFEGPDTTTSEMLSGAKTSSACSAVTAAAAPYPSPKWEVPLISPLFGYPSAGSFMNGRLCLGGIDGASNLFVASSTRAVNDFQTGLDDDDAIIRTFGSGDKALKHIVDAGDMLLFTNGGVYVVDARDGVQITPSSFAPSLVDARGCNDVTPVYFNDKVVYVNAGGDALLAAVLDGNIYLKWSVIEFSKGSSHLINNPRTLCAPAPHAKEENSALIFANQDGSAVAVFGDSQRNDVGFFPWCGAVEPTAATTVTEYWSSLGADAGKFLDFVAVDDAIWAFVYRGYDGSGLNGTVYLEKMDKDVRLDCVTAYTGGSTPDLSAYTAFDSVSVVNGDYFEGEFDTLADVTTLIEGGSASETYHVGVRFMPRFSPWPKEFVESRHYGMRPARTIRVSVSVLNTTSFYCYRNRTKADILPYSVGDDMSAPPPAKTKTYKFPVLGNRDHPSIEIGQEYPGAWSIAKITMEVQV